MADGHITVRISAAADRSVENVFGSIERRGAKMRDNLNRATRTSVGTTGDQQIRAADKAAAAAERAAKRAADAQTREAARAAREVEKSYKAQQTALDKVAREQDRIFERQARSAQRARDREVREATRAAERQARQEAYYQRSMAYRTAYHGVIRYFPGAMGHAARASMDVLRGAGVDPSLAGSVGRSVSLNTAAVGLANQERIATGQSRGPAYYENLARGVGQDLSVDPEQAIDLMRQFTARTGEFDVAGNKLREMASIALASGANFNEFGSAAGYVYSQLKDMPDAGNRTVAVMRGIVGQTAVGAVEMEEYAKQMGRIAANAHMMVGPADKNIMKMSALAQFVVEAGGGTGGADAARSLVSLMTTPQKGARRKAFEKHGVSLYTDNTPGKRTQLRDITDIIKDSISKTGGDLPALNEMWMDVLGAKSVKGLSTLYREAAGGTSGTAAEKDAAGRKAIDQALDKYMRAQLDKATEEKNIAEHQRSPAAKAQQFQNNLDKIVSVVATKVIPPLESAAPSVLKFAEAMGRVAAWAADNPGKAIAAAFLLSLARAGIETLVRHKIERWFNGVGRGGAPLFGGPGGAPPGAIVPAGTLGGAVRAGGASAAFNAAVGGLMGYSAGSAVDAVAGSQKQGLFSMIGAGAGAGAAYGPWGALIGAGGGALGALFKPGGLIDEFAAVTKHFTFGEKVAGGSSGADYDRMMAEYRKSHPGAVGGGGAAGPPKITAEMDPTQITKALGDTMRSTTIRVHVVNASDLKQTQPQVDPRGRAPN